MKFQGFIGKTTDGDAVYVEIEIDTTTVDRPVQTIHHDTVTEVARVSICGHYFHKGSRRKDWTGGGQCVNMVAAVTRPAVGLTAKDISRLVEIWNSQHLNDMRAGCAHQTPVFRKDMPNQYDLDAVPPCPETGYRFGSAWLYEVPSPEALADLERIGALLDGEDGMR